MAGHTSSRPHALAVPLPFQGHIHPLLQLSKKLVSAGFMVTFANTQANHKRITGFFSKPASQKEGAGDADTEEVADGGLHFVSLEEGIPAELDDVVHILTELLKPRVRSAVAQLLARLCQKDPPVTLLIFDFRLPFLLDVAREAGVLSLSFWTQSAASFACNLAVVQGFQPPAPDDSTLITCVEGIPPFKSLEITGVFVEQVPPPFPSKSYAWDPFKRVHEPNWIVFNTFEELEATTLNTLCARLGFRPITLGPLVDTPSFSVARGIKEINKVHLHLDWLQRHPQESVLYISFGTVMTLSEEQLEELVLGLEASQQPILWVFRPQLCGNSKRFTVDTLSRRFMSQGLVVDWASQSQILLHPAIGGFLTHCGWNSTLEGITMGVPMLGWPGFADQFLNKRCLEEQWGICLGFEVNVGTSNFISRIEIEKSVRRLIQSPKAKVMREKARSLSTLAKQAIEEGGSSWQNFALFVQSYEDTYLKEVASVHGRLSEEI